MTFSNRCAHTAARIPRQLHVDAAGVDARPAAQTRGARFSPLPGNGLCDSAAVARLRNFARCFHVTRGTRHTSAFVAAAGFQAMFSRSGRIAIGTVLPATPAGAVRINFLFRFGAVLFTRASSLAGDQDLNSSRTASNAVRRCGTPVPLWSISTSSS